MKKVFKILFFFIPFLLILSITSQADSFKVTRVYDGATVRAEEYG
jgi:hypothetical protein